MLIDAKRINFAGRKNHQKGRIRKSQNFGILRALDE